MTQFNCSCLHRKRTNKDIFQELLIFLTKTEADPSSLNNNNNWIVSHYFHFINEIMDSAGYPQKFFWICVFEKWKKCAIFLRMLRRILENSWKFSWYSWRWMTKISVSIDFSHYFCIIGLGFDFLSNKKKIQKYQKCHDARILWILFTLFTQLQNYLGIRNWG